MMGPSFTLSKTMCVVTYTDLLSSFMRNETQASAYHLISYGVSLLLSIGCSMPLFHITAILRLVDPIISVGQGCGGSSLRLG